MKPPVCCCRRTRPSRSSSGHGAASRSAPTPAATLTSAAAPSPAFLAEEILGSKRDLEQLLAREVRYFACPYGLHKHMTPAAFAACYAAGFAGVCSAYGGYNIPGDDPFHLQRFHADPEMIRLKNWITVDPLKLKKHVRFNPGDYRQNVNNQFTTALAAMRERMRVKQNISPPSHRRIRIV